MSSPNVVQQYDLVVVGGGPSGSTLATLVAMRGWRVLLIEKETFPRHQIGESLLPATVHGICRLIGVQDQLAAAGFLRKNGGTFRWGADPVPWEFSFSSSDHFTGDNSYAYQVERMKFDHILLENARAKGVDVRERCAAVGVIEEEGEERVRGLTYTDQSGQKVEVHARWVADASGNTSRIYKSVGGERIYSDYFRNVAVYGYYEGGGRLPEPKSGNIFCPTFDDGWFWYIPLSADLTSVGAVVRRDAVHRIQGDPDGALAQFIEECPPIKSLLADATRVTDGVYGKVRVRKDYSYHHTQFWRPGMLIVGDAACFVDPVLSSGVHLATYGALTAARSVNAALSGDVEEKVAFDEYELRYRQEFGRFYEYLVSFYNLNAETDSYFWAAKKVTNAETSELEAFVELVGGASSGETALTDADTLRSRLGQGTQDLAAAVSGELSDGTDRAASLHRSQTIRKAMRSSVDLQISATLGRTSKREKPLRPGGPIPSPDGLSWVLPEAA